MTPLIVRQNVAASVRDEQGLRFLKSHGEKLPGRAAGGEQTNSDALAASCSGRCGLN